ncbi:unnamed protein product, partial [Meganyctiphanes norvegica]
CLLGEAFCGSSSTQGLAVMRILAAISVLAFGANALVGPSGIVSPDGKNIQFSSIDEFNNLLYAGPSGVITKDGKNIQLTADQQTLYSNLQPKDVPVAPVVDSEPAVRATLTNEENDNAAVVGPSGIVNHDGVNVQFDAAPTVSVLLNGPSGIVMSDGTLIQKKVSKRSLPLIGPSGMIDEDLNQIQFDGSPGLAVRTKLSKAELLNAAVIGPSGIVNKDGVNVQFDKLPEPDILLEGPSGYVMTDGSLRQKVVKRSAPLIGPSGMLRADGTQVQFTDQEASVRSALTQEENVNAAVVGPSGIVNFDGVNVQFGAPEAPTVLLDGPSGQVMSDGTLIQKVVKRSALPLVGPSGMLLADGTQVQFDNKDLEQRKGLTPEQNAKAVVFGPSGIVLNDGMNIQFGADSAPPSPSVVLDGPSGQVLSDGTLIQKVVKRSLPLVSPSGMILGDGTQVQFKTADAAILLDGTSGIVMSDGTLVQKRSKRHLIGHSDIITDQGELTQLPAGVTVVAAGPSGFVLSNGENIQLT